MELYEIEEIKTATLKLSFRKSESVEVDEKLLPSEYFTFRESKAPNKIKLKELLKAGEEIPGAQLITNNNLQIK